MEARRYGQTGFYYSIRACSSEDVDHEIFITPDDPDIAPLAGIKLQIAPRRNRAAVYAAKRRRLLCAAAS